MHNRNVKKSCFNIKIYDFMHWSNLLFLISGLLIIISIIIIIIHGLNWGIDFTGGMVLQLIFEKSVNLDQIRIALKNTDFKDVILQYFGNNKEIIIRMSLIETSLMQQLSDELVFLINNITSQNLVLHRLEYIGPNVSNNLKQTSIITIVLAFISILIYVSFRFEWRIAVSTIFSLIHDLLIILGILSIFKIEINLSVIVSLISVIGYSLNDNIIVSDRIRENFRKKISDNTYDIFNISLSQTLSRTLITSTTTILAVIMLLIFGGSILFGFSITFIIGVFIGTISSIYIASALALKLGLQYKHLLK